MKQKVENGGSSNWGGQKEVKTEEGGEENNTKVI